jgi:hypothetical protein
MSNQNSAVFNVFMTGVFRAKKALATLTGKDLSFVNVVCRDFSASTLRKDIFLWVEE